MKYTLSICLAVGLFINATTVAYAQDCPDLPGFEPLAELPVYDGACLFGADDQRFAQMVIPTGPMMKNRVLESSETIEGQVQRRLYVAPDGATPLEVFANYRNALTALGFETLFECSDRACGSNNALLGQLVIYSSERKLTNLGRASEFALYIEGDEHFLSVKSADGSRYITVYVARNQSGPIVGQAAGRAAVHIELGTTDELTNRMIDAAAMAQGITDDGHIALDNVFFDFGTAVLTAEAAPAVAEMVKLLTDNPNLSVMIVGHTDWVGDSDANLTLSQARAASVVAALVAAGIASDRVSPAGVGMLAPRASNTTDAGRSLNRRVELVERPAQ